MSCSLYGILARDAKRAVILRRGPTRRVQLILWHTDTDTFDEGQWFYGRIYESRCDLSPDGTLFLYLAQKAKTRERLRSSTTHRWTALSKPPYFTALKLWPCGDTWQGGGLFLSDHLLWLCHNRDEVKERTYRHFTIQTSFNFDRFVEHGKLNGWEYVQGIFSHEHLAGNEPSPRPGLRFKAVTHQPAIWRKFHPHRRFCIVKEFYREPDFSFRPLIYLEDTSTNEQQLLEGTTWIDWDQQGRLVYARDGKLFASLDTENNPLQVQEIADFNANTPNSVIAPYTTKKWQ